MIWDFVRLEEGIKVILLQVESLKGAADCVHRMMQAVTVGVEDFLWEKANVLLKKEKTLA